LIEKQQKSHKKTPRLKISKKNQVSAMSNIVSRLDITQIFCDVDDLCNQWERLWQQVPQLPSLKGERRSKSRMHISEVMTIAIAFHGSGYKTFKEFYTLHVLQSWRGAFPNLVS
jgi:hypothetical protein